MSGLEEGRHEAPRLGEERELRRGVRRSDGGSARRVVANFWQLFGKMSLVFGCIGTDLCKQIRVLQHFSKSTRLSS